MKYLVLAMFLYGCAHTNDAVQPSHRATVMEQARLELNAALEKNPVAYGSMIPGTRFLQLVDLILDSNAEVGVAIIEAKGESREPMGKIFIYIYCESNGKCRPVQAATKVEAPIQPEKRNAQDI